MSPLFLGLPVTSAPPVELDFSPVNILCSYCLNDPPIGERGFPNFLGAEGGFQVQEAVSYSARINSKRVFLICCIRSGEAACTDNTLFLQMTHFSRPRSQIKPITAFC